MKNKFLKMIATTTAVIFFTCSVSFAALPLLAYVGSVLLHTAVVAGYVWLTSKPSGSGAANSSGDITVGANVQWVDLTMPEAPTTNNQAVTVTKTKAQIKAAVNANPSKYPKLKAALDGETSSNPTPTKISTLNHFPVTGEVLQDDPSEAYYKITGLNFQTATGYMNLSHPPSDPRPTSPKTDYFVNFNTGNGMQVIETAHTYPLDEDYADGTWLDSQVITNRFYNYDSNITYTVTTTFVETVSTPSGDLKSDYQKEMETLIPSSGGHTTANVQVGSDVKNPSGTGFSPTAPTAAQVAAGGGAPPATPGSTTPSGGTVPPGSTPSKYGDGTEFKFGERFTEFMGDMKGTALFSLPSKLIGTIPGGGQSSFDISFGRMGSTTFDLASYGPGIAVIRILVMAVFLAGAVKIVCLKGGSQ